MHGAAICYIVLAQVSFFIGMFICVLLEPRYVLGKNQGGVSNYATDKRTVLPYSLAFLLEAAFTLITAHQLLHALHSYRLLIAALIVLAVLLLIVLTSSYVYKRNALLHWLHFFWGIVLITYQSVFGILLLGYMHRYLVAYIALVVLLVGDAVCILSLRNVVQRLFLGQVITRVAFAALLCGATITI